MYSDITGIILSGGKSTRMGQNKSFMKIGDQTIIDRIITLMKSLFKEVIIITNEPELYEYTGLKIYEDIYKNVGPLAGIHSGLIHSNTEMNFIISCDIPLMNAEMIGAIISHSDGYDITVPKADGFIQQLCGVYKQTIISEIENIINSDKQQETRDDQQTKRKCKVHSLLHACKTHVIENTEELPGSYPEIFFNMNSPEDFKKINSFLSK